MDSKIKKHCPNCSKNYCLMAIQGKSHIPLQLPCGHNICLNCIKNKVKFSEPVECRVCKIEIPLSTTDRQMMMIKQNMIHDKFPIDYYLYGQLSVGLLAEAKSVDVHDKYPQDYYIDVKALMEDSNTVANCAECKNKTFKKCQQCDIVLCDPCFAKIHNYVQSFKHHTRQNIDFVNDESNTFCPSHTDKTLDYYCKDCNMAKCLDCTFLGGEKSCKNHDVVLLREKSSETLNDVMAMAPALDEHIRHMSATAIQIANLLKKIDQGDQSQINDVIEQAQHLYSKLHYAVQKSENDVMNALEGIKKMQKESLLLTRKEIATNMQIIKNVLRKIDVVMHGDAFKKVNVSKLLETATNAANLPCFLTKAENNNDLTLEVNEDIFKMIDDFIKLKGNLDGAYKLVGKSDIPEGFTIPPAPDSMMFPPELVRVGDDDPDSDKYSEEEDAVFEYVREKIFKQTPHTSNPAPVVQTPKFCKKFVPNSYKKTDNADQLSTCSSKSADSNTTVDEEVKPMKNGCKEMVFLSHIEDPHNFYAQRVRQQKLLKDMNGEFENASHLPKLTKDRVNFGQIYLGYTEVHNQWQRCRVVKNCYDESDNPIFELFFIDYGVTEFVTIDKLRHIPTKRLSNPPMLAIHCKLANCEPIQGTWKPDDAILMHKIVNNKKAMLFVCSDKEPGEKYVCDVVTYEDDMSLAHCLVFHERARLINTNIKPPTIYQFEEKLKIYSSVNDLSINSNHEVFITHVVNPDKFYVRKSHLMSTYKKLCQEMSKAYKGSSNPVHCPTEEMICAIDVTKCGGVADRDSSWRRAIVRALLGEQRVTIYLPDTGEVYDVHHTALRRMQTKFVKYKSLAIECHLSCVTTTKKLWSKEAVELLESYRDTLLQLQVEKDVRDRNSTSVVLHCISDESDTSICINNELIQKRLAIAIGMPIFTRISTSISRADSTTVKQNSKIQNKKPMTTNGEIKILKKKDNEENLKPMDKGPIKLEVRILSCPSPSLIYVSLVDQKEIMLELYKNIQNYFSKKKPCERQWQVGASCCGFCNESKTWRRAIITELHDGEATLFFTDFANSEKVAYLKIMELPPHLAEISDAAIKCHLSGVVPAIGGDWPSLTKEYLKELIDGYQRFFITKNGIIKDKSLPIELWVYHKIAGGALEPNRAEWRCLNHKIIEQGLGIPDKLHKNKDDAEQSKEVLLNMAGSLNKWLELEASGSSKYVESNIGDAVTNDWIPAVPLESAEFTGTPTYIDNYAVIYLHDVTQEETINNIRTILAKINDTASTSELYTEWLVGEPCLAKFYLDDQLYRGRIVDIYPDDNQCLINYVDYGNEEICSYENIRTVKELCEEMFKIPIQSNRCMLAHVKSPIQERWERNTLDHIHGLIVDHTCLVRVIGDKVNDLIPIEIKVKDIWLHKYLLDTQQVVFDRNDTLNIPSLPQKTSSTESLTDPDYFVDKSDSESLKTIESVHSMDITKDWVTMMDESFEEKKGPEDPEEGTFYTFEKNIEKESFTCTILVITNFDTFDLIPKLDPKVQHLYQEVSEEMQLKGDDMPPLNGVYENKACIARFPEDKVWYRASILEYSEALEKIKVKYVDYGNIEIVPLSQVKEIDPKWISPPPVTIPVKIYGYVRNSKVGDDVLKKEYVKTFLDKTLQVNVIEKDDSVHLVELRDVKDNTLVYQPLIDNKIFVELDK